ncbi:hypothetical protein F4825DRAFT_453849 [Nemania diffusa]|nr:hypothetical protein F4825DRAFT_453849 [Nemania diffusa]
MSDGLQGVDCSPSMRLIPMQKVRHLSNNFSPIVLRGFSETKDEEAANSRDDSKMSNNVTSNEPIPIHFDGAFKFAEKRDPLTGEVKKALDPLGYQYFTCSATAPKGDRYTLFCSARLAFRYLPMP